MKIEEQVTGVVVTYNTHKLLVRSVISIRKRYPKMQIIVIDNSSDGNENIGAVNIVKTYKNIGHGPGMHLGASKVWTPKILFFDSDIVLVRAGVLEQMLNQFDENTYGVGQVIKVSRQGQNSVYTPLEEKTVNYLHPFFMVVDKKKYFEFPHFIHHGAPCIKTMLALQGSETKLIDFPIKRFVKHAGRGTRKLRPAGFNSKTWEEI